MDVTFQRTGPKRYTVVVAVPGEEPQEMSPAPGYDDRIPHDLVHYLVESELGLTLGVYGRAARGGGTFRPVATGRQDPRERRRAVRRRQHREEQLRRTDHAKDTPGTDRSQMALSERLAFLCDVGWRRRHGQHGEAADWITLTPPPADEQARVERVLDRLDHVAPLWQALPDGGALTFAWPSPVPVPATARAS